MDTSPPDWDPSRRQPPESGRKFPWEDVEASRNNARLQKRHRMSPQMRDIIRARAVRCPQCGTAPESLSWFFFESPPFTWADLCGTSGWMAVCDRCQIQVNYFETLLN